jgi:DNA polymerase, archaea type
MQDEWLWGWDPTPGIVSVWAEPDGRAWVWRRLPASGELVCERERFRPWALLASLDDLQHLGERLVPETGTPSPHAVTYEELSGPGELRYLVRCDDGRALTAALLRGASRRVGWQVGSLRQLEEGEVLALAPEEQYLVASGRTYFRALAFDDLRRAQFDLETTGLHPESSRIFLIAARSPDGETAILEAAGEGDQDERELVLRLMQQLRTWDPDVIENHNLHGFDLPFLAARAARLGVPLALGRGGGPGLRQRPAARGASFGASPEASAAASPAVSAGASTGMSAGASTGTSAGASAATSAAASPRPARGSDEAPATGGRRTPSPAASSSTPSTRSAGTTSRPAICRVTA